MEQFGIENLKTALRTTINFADRVQECLEDGRFDLWEKIGLLGEGSKFVQFINKSDEIKQEYLDLSKQEQHELCEYLTEEFDLENDRIEQIIEQAFAVALSLDALVKSIRK